MMNKETQETFLYGYNTVDCCVRKKNIFYFVVREDYTRWPKSKWDGDSSGPPEGDVEKRVLAWFRDKKDANAWSNTFLRGIDIPICEAPTKPREHFVGVAGKDVYSMGSGDGGFESDIPYFEDDGPFKGSASKLRVIDGWLYGCGLGKSVGKRNQRGEWYSFTKLIPNHDEMISLDDGFSDIDGFSESDIYCAGGLGHVYHFNGKDWRALAFPSNTNLQSLCCAGDGNVYISGMHGVVFKGRSEKWKNIHKAQLAGMVLGFKDMVWYEDRVWCTSDYGLWTIHNDKLTQADVPDFVRACSGNLSVADGVLLLAGYGGAAFRENGQWHPIY